MGYKYEGKNHPYVGAGRLEGGPALPRMERSPQGLTGGREQNGALAARPAARRARGRGGGELELEIEIEIGLMKIEI